MGLLVAILVVAVAGALAFLFFRSFWPKVYAWMLSDREEKAALTRLKGHYNANGYLVSSESDFRLSGTGSFKRFESVDSDGIAEIATGPVVIPPQPLRPAPPRPPSPPPQQQEGGGGVMCVEPATPGLKRAISCDSVCSDSSVGPQDLVSSYISGYLCIGIDYDSECGDLIVSVIEAKDLVCKELGDVTALLDTYVCLYLLPEKVAIMQTRTYRGSNSPSFKEKFLFGVEWKDWGRSSLMFHVYAAHRDANTLVGEAQLLLSDVPTKQPITTWLTLADSNQSECSLGEILFSLSYLPTAERLTVVVVKARNLKLTNDQAEPFVKVYLLRNGKKVHKKKTSYKRGDPSPIFNEAMIFSVPNHLLHVLQIRVSAVESHGSGNEEVTLGHVIIGGDAEGKALSHWSQMLISLRKPVAMWHPLLTKNSLP